MDACGMTVYEMKKTDFENYLSCPRNGIWFDYDLPISLDVC